MSGKTSSLRQSETRSPEGGVTYAPVLDGIVAPSQPRGSLKPTAMDSDVYEPAVSFQTANRRMCSVMSRPLSDKPDVTTLNAQLANTSLPAGELPNKTPIFISDVPDTRDFLTWLRASCLGGLTVQLKSENLMFVPLTADELRPAVGTLRSLDGKEGVRFHTFTLPEDRCVRLRIKNLGMGMPESIVREEIESLKIRVQGLTQLRSGRRDQDANNPIPTPTSLYQCREV